MIGRTTFGGVAVVGCGGAGNVCYAAGYRMNVRVREDK